MAVFRVEKTKDYSVISNHHFRNTELSLKAKGLLGLMLSFPDDWDYTLAGLVTRSRDGIDSVREGLKELEKYGYLERRRARNETGQLKGTEYIIREVPILEKPILENPTQANPTLEKPTQANPMQLNTNKQITQKPNTNIISDSSNPIPSYNPSLEDVNAVDNSDMGKERKGKDEKQSPYSFWERQIMTNIDYESLMQSYPYDQKLINEIVSIMVETVMSNRKMIRIAGDDYPFSVVKEKFLGIDYSHIQYIIDCFNEGARNTEIKNIKQYMKALIFNAPTTIDSYYTAKVRYDMPWLGQKQDD